MRSPAVAARRVDQRSGPRNPLSPAPTPHVSLACYLIMCQFKLTAWMQQNCRWLSSLRIRSSAGTDVTASLGLPCNVHSRELLGCGVVAGPLFVGSFLAQGATRDAYSPKRHPVSSLALGPRGWVQIANFAVTGGLYLCFAVGLSRTLGARIRTRLGPVLLGAGAVGMLGAAAFRTDPVSGYPPGTPDRPTRASTLGVLHDLFSVPTFLCIPAAGLAFGRAFLRVGERGWAAYSAASGLGMLAAFALASLGFSQQHGPAARHFVEIGGALQRASIAIGVAWLTSLAARALIEPPSSPFDTAAGAG